MTTWSQASHVNPPIITGAIATRFLRDYLGTFFDVWGRTLDRAWDEIKRDFPNLLLMGVTAIGVIFDIPFLPIQAALENFGRAMIPNARFYRRFVITGEDAFKMNVEFITRGTLRAGMIDQSLGDMFLTWLASRVFRWISGGGLLQRIGRLMGIVTYDDALRWIRSSITRQLAIRAVSLMLTFFSLGYGVIVLLNMALSWAEVFEGLQQRNPRRRGLQRNRVRTR